MEKRKGGRGGRKEKEENVKLSEGIVGWSVGVRDR